MGVIVERFAAGDCPGRARRMPRLTTNDSSERVEYTNEFANDENR